MKNSKASKIVVAVGLAAVYGTGLAMVTLRHAPDNHAAQNAAVASTTQLAQQPAAVTAAPAPVASAAVSNLEATTREAESVKAEVPRKEVKIARETGIANVATGSVAETSYVEKQGTIGEAASTGNDSVNSTIDAPSSGQAESASTGNDSQIVADVST